MKKRKPELLPMIPDREIVLDLLGGLVAVVGWATLALGVATTFKYRLVQLGCVLVALYWTHLLGYCWQFAHWLRIQRLARPVLSLLTNPGPDPAGLVGPYLSARGRGPRTCFWLVGNDRARSTASLVLTRNDTGCGPPLLAGAHGLHSEPPPPPAVCRALLRELLPANWLLLETNEQTFIFGCDPASTMPVELEDATRRRLPPDLSRFRRPIIEVPEPIAFPREPFAQELEQHRALVREHTDSLAFQAREPADEWFDAFFHLPWNVGEIDVRGAQGKSVFVLSRAPVAARYEKQLGIRRRLQSEPEDGCLEVVVCSDNLVSLHVTRLRVEHGPKGTVSRFLELDESAPAIVEPTRQEHARYRGKTVVYWQAEAGRKIHRAETTAPEPTGPIGDAVDRHLAFHRERIHRVAWDWNRLGDGFVWVVASPTSGDRVAGVDRATAGWLGVLYRLPTIRRAVALHRDHRRWYPVVIDAIRYGGLRWLAVHAGLDEATRPPNLDEVPTDEHLRIVAG
jgi:hypothetical protein